VDLASKRSLYFSCKPPSVFTSLRGRSLPDTGAARHIVPMPFRECGEQSLAMILEVASSGRTSSSQQHIQLKQKTLHPHQGRRAFSAVPPSLRSAFERHFVAVTGLPGVDYFIHQHSLSFEKTGEFGLLRSVPLTLVLGFHLTLPTR